MLSKGNLFNDLAHLLKVKTHIVVLEIVLNSLKSRASDSIIVEFEEAIKINPAILIDIILVDDEFYSVVILCA